jgi:hypothetical protein
MQNIRKKYKKIISDYKSGASGFLF